MDNDSERIKLPPTPAALRQGWDYIVKWINYNHMTITTVYCLDTGAISREKEPTLYATIKGSSVTATPEQIKKFKAAVKRIKA